MSRKIEWITVAQILSCLFIVFHHSFPSGVDCNPYLLSVANAIHYPSLAIFFFASGFLGEKSFIKNGYLQLVKTKVIRLLLPYIILNVLVLPFKMLVEYIFIGTTSFSILTLVGFVSPHNYGVLPHLWYLLCLFIMFLSTPFIYYLSNKRYFILFLVLPFLVLSFFSLELSDYFTLNDFLKYYIFFILGFAISNHNFEFLMIKSRIILLVLFLISTISFFTIILFSIGNLFVGKQFLITLIGFISILNISILISNHYGVLRVFDKKTFTIYLLSLCFQNFIEVILLHFSLNIYLIIFLNFFAGLILPIFVFILVSRLYRKVHINGILLAIIGMREVKNEETKVKYS